MLGMIGKCRNCIRVATLIQISLQSIRVATLIQISLQSIRVTTLIENPLKSIRVTVLIERSIKSIRVVNLIEISLKLIRVVTLMRFERLSIFNQGRDPNLSKVQKVLLVTIGQKMSSSQLPELLFTCVFDAVHFGVFWLCLCLYCRGRARITQHQCTLDCKNDRTIPGSVLIIQH